MKRFGLAGSVILPLLVLVSATLSCNFNETEEKTNLFNHYYSIEPELLLDSLKAGKTNVFFPIAGEPVDIPLDQQILVPWTQNDYLRIANALYEFVNSKTLDSWQLNSMDFASGCEEFDAGFQHGNFEFFKIVKTDERESRIALIININPRGKYVFITENKYYPKLVDWSSIDLEQNQLSASDVLQIAENAGGQAKRLSVDNACNISIWFSPDSASYSGWVAHYYRRDDGITLFQANIDPIKGEIYSP
ncbi:MAG: hypothetical protein M3R47_06115 [Chloroflexota bacterium]|nr:hypothetical protein [Chloroflexota bacterium]